MLIYTFLLNKNEKVIFKTTRTYLRLVYLKVAATGFELQ